MWGGGERLLMEHNRDHRVEPEYTMQAVVSRTGVPADTIRSWERRHGFPRPGRDGTNHRVYSEADIQAILQLTELKASGLAMPQAIARLRHPDQASRRNDEPAVPAFVPQNASFPSLAAGATGRTGDDLATLLDAYDGAAARCLLDDMLTVRSVEDILFSLLLPLHDSHTNRDADHAFRAGFIRQLLFSLYNASAPDTGRVTIVLAGVPGTKSESHLLCHAIALSRAGYRTLFMGVDVALHHVEAALERIRPHAVLMSADTEGSAWTLARWCDRLDRERPIPGWDGVLLFAGPVFTARPGLANDVAATRVPEDPAGGRAVVESTLGNPPGSLRVLGET